MTKKQKRLGRGLDALLSKTAAGGTEEVAGPESRRAGEPESGPVANGVADLQGEGTAPAGGSSTVLRSARNDGRSGVSVAEVEIKSVVRNPHQPRSAWDDEKLAALSASIQANGLIQPILVREISFGTADGGDMEHGQDARTTDMGKMPVPQVQYQLIAGERRLRAAQMAGLERVAAIVRDASEEQMLEWALVENIHRADLNPIERARAYRQFMVRFRQTQEQAAAKLGEDRATLANYVRLLDLPEHVQQLVIEGGLSMGHARALLGAVGHKDFDWWVQQAYLNAWSVRHLEEVIRITKDVASGPVEPGQTEAVKSANIVELEKDLTRHVGMKVEIKPKRGKGHKGKVLIEYYDLDGFDRIKELLLG